MAEAYKPKHYVPREGLRYPNKLSSGMIFTARGVCHCRHCDRHIRKGEKHFRIESHLSSGRVSYINICKECVSKLARELL